MATYTKDVKCIGYNSYYSYRVDVSDASPNPALNTTAVTVSFYMNAYGGSAGYEDWSTRYAVYIDGVNVSGEILSGVTTVNSGSTYIYIGSWTGNVVHGDDGTKTISVGVSCRNGSDFWNSASYLPQQNNGSGSYPSGTPAVWSMAAAHALTKVDRAASVSMQAMDIGQTGTISVSRPAENLTVSIDYAFGALSGNIAEKTSAASVNWDTSALKSSLIAQLPNAASGLCTLTAKTYYGNTLTGSSTANVTLTVPAGEDTRPTAASLTKTPSGTLNGCYVQGKSSVAVTVNGAAAKLGASVALYETAVGQNAYSSAEDTVSSGILTQTGTVDISAYVKDTRGISSTPALTDSICVYPYAAPYISSVTAQRYEDVTYTYTIQGGESGTCCFTVNAESYHFTMPEALPTALIFSYVSEKLYRDSLAGSEVAVSTGSEGTDITAHLVKTLGEANDAGECLMITVDGGVSPIGDAEQNTLDCTVTIGTVTKTVAAQPPVVSNYCIFRISADAQLAATAAVTDVYEASTTYQLIIPTASVTLDFKASGEGAAFGKTAETDNLLDVAWNLRVRGENGLSLDSPLGIANGGTGKTTLAELTKLWYPVGSIYISVDSTDPGTLFGGTWAAWGAGRVPVGVDSTQTEFDTVEETGGEKTHTLTIAEMPSHNHTAVGTVSASGSGRSNYTTTGNHNWDGYTAVYNTGGGGAHNNLQPYITCHMWKRTA